MGEINLLTSNLDLSVLDNLSPEQRELALSILQEYAQTGGSKAYSELIMEDYAEAPVDILTFVDDYNYLGNAWHDAEGNSKLYPYWREELLKIFPDNLTTTVNNGIFSGSRGRGKEQPLSSLVLTEHGYIAMGDVKVGTKVYGSDGRLHPVTAIYPQGVKDIYKITFSDNTSARCGLRHLWQVEKDGKSSVVDIKQLLEYSKKEPLKNYFIPLCQPINFDAAGDVDETYQKGRDFVLDISNIVTEDLYSNISIRTALLQGILDTSGDVAEKFIKISDANVALKKVVSWLVHSLGGIITAEGTSLKIFLPENITPFRSPKKLALYNNISHIQPYRYIASIEKLPYKEACQCIMVDSEEHLYITDNFIVTHNTEVATLIAAYLLHRILCLKDPIAYYHLKPTEKIVFAFMNIKLALAEEIGITKFQNTLQSSPWFMSHGELEGRTKKIWVPQKYNNQIAVDIKIGSQADDLIGLPIFFCLSGDTPIVTDKGIYNIETLENKIIRVPSLDDTGHIILSDECTVKQTAATNDYIEIELEDGTIIKCTYNHRFMLKDGSYKEAQYLTTEDELMDTKPFGYIYKFTDLTTNKIYIGKRETTSFDKNYWGSGKLWSEVVTKIGKQNVKREVLCFATSRQELRELEVYYISKYKSTDPNIDYNIHKGGAGGNSLNDKAKWSELHQGSRNGRYGVPTSEETRHKISIANKGRRYSAEINKTKGRLGVAKPQGFGEKASKAQKGRVKSAVELEHLKEGAKKAAVKNKGKIIYNNGVEEIRLLPPVSPPEGFVKGRLPKISENLKTLFQNHNRWEGYHWYTNGKEELYAKTCPSGFTNGRLHK